MPPGVPGHRNHYSAFRQRVWSRRLSLASACWRTAAAELSASRCCVMADVCSAYITPSDRAGRGRPAPAARDAGGPPPVILSVGPRSGPESKDLRAVQGPAQGEYVAARVWPACRVRTGWTRPFDGAGIGTSNGQKIYRVTRSGARPLPAAARDALADMVARRSPQAAPRGGVRCAYPLVRVAACQKSGQVGKGKFLSKNGLICEREI